MDITFLEADTPLVKTFSKDRNGSIKKSNYPHVRDFTSHTYTIRTLKEFFAKLKAHAEEGHCLLKGELQRELTKESRAGSTSPNTPTNWVCLDVDGLPGVDTAEDFITLLPRAFHDVSYIAQYSASMGVIDKGLSCHIIFALYQEALPSTLKQWLTRLNLDTEQLRNALSLTRTQNTLRWPLDITVCQNDKLIFIAPPQLKDGVTSTLDGNYIQLITKKSHTVKFDFSTFNPGNLRKDTIAAINEKRKAAGLPAKRQIGEKVFKDVSVVTASTQAEITGIREDRSFTYLNLNGGDSWGYYHPTGNPDVIYNFKGEPNYLGKELLPEYYAEQKADAKNKKKHHIDPERSEEGYRYFAFIDREADIYYRGKYNEETADLDCISTSKRTHVADYFKQHGQPVPDHLDLWNVEMDFTDAYHIDFKRKKLNLFTPSQFLLDAQTKTRAAIPPLIKRIIHSAVGSDDESYEAFINWLACILQLRMKTGTAWILHGTQGTGKGLLFNNILTPLIGQAYAARTTMDTLAESTWNDFMEKSVFCLIDEARMLDAAKSKRLDSRLREYITEPHITLQKRFAHEKTIKNFTNFLIFSNDTDPAHIPNNDRRMNVAKRQNKQLVITEEEINSLPGMLQQFTDFLFQYEADAAKARKPLMNETREEIKFLTQDTNQEAANRILDGNLHFLFENRPHMEIPGELLEQSRSNLPSYKEVLLEILHNLDTGSISRDSLHTLFYYITGNIFATPHKFTKFLAHKGISVKNIRMFNSAGAYEQSRGLHGIVWDCDDELHAEISRWASDAEPEAKKKQETKNIKKKHTNNVTSIRNRYQRSHKK